MSAGMSAAWRAKQQKPKRCQRCELYYSASLDTCDQCATLSEAQLTLFKIKRQKILQKNATFGKYLLGGAFIIGLLLLVSFL